MGLQESRPSGASVIVLGGGFAGLAAATALAERGARVTVLEKKPHLGGRAYSFTDPSGRVVDNGQHLFMGCYWQTRRFLARVGAEGGLRLAPEIRVDYADASARRSRLSCPVFLPPPYHLAFGVLGLSGLSLPHKLSLVRLNRALLSYKRKGVPAELDRMTVREWLRQLSLPARVQERLIDPIALGVLNDAPEVAAATGLAQALVEMFCRDVESSRLGLAAVGLSDLYTEQARKFIEARGGKVLLSSKAASVIARDGRVAGVALDGAGLLEASTVVSTLAPWDLRKVSLPPALRGPWENLGASPIIGISLWLDRQVVAEPLVGMLGTEIQWCFNKTKILGLGGDGQYLALVISGARKQLSLEPKALVELACRDMELCFPAFAHARVLGSQVIKEPFATLSPVPGSDALRPPVGSPMPGFVLAGDWTRTGLPATIESAVLSGHRAAELALE